MTGSPRLYIAIIPDLHSDRMRGSGADGLNPASLLPAGCEPPRATCRVNHKTDRMARIGQHRDESAQSVADFANFWGSRVVSGGGDDAWFASSSGLPEAGLRQPRSAKAPAQYPLTDRQPRPSPPSERDATGTAEPGLQPSALGCQLRRVAPDPVPTGRRRRGSAGLRCG